MVTTHLNLNNNKDSKDKEKWDQTGSPEIPDRGDIRNAPAYVYMYVIILKHAYTHRGWGTLTMSQHNIFDSQKVTIFFSCAPDGVQNLGVFGSRVPDALPTEPPRHRILNYPLCVSGVGGGRGKVCVYVRANMLCRLFFNAFTSQRFICHFYLFFI